MSQRGEKQIKQNCCYLGFRFRNATENLTGKMAPPPQKISPFPPWAGDGAAWSRRAVCEMILERRRWGFSPPDFLFSMDLYLLVFGIFKEEKVGYSVPLFWYGLVLKLCAPAIHHWLIGKFHYLEKCILSRLQLFTIGKYSTKNKFRHLVLFYSLHAPTNPTSQFSFPRASSWSHLCLQPLR